ncbi:SDR family oxidoreductase [Croceiramulus getboli]|nr:SDR family oxidoreductase [Flavobacteriaceae bacterium YJPT1-3]
MSSIAIAGMGWLGLPLAQRMQALGYNVKGSVSTTTKAADLTARGFNAHAIMLTEQGVEGDVEQFLADVDTLYILIPPGLRRNSGANHALKMAYFLSAVEDTAVGQVVLVSSTSVYSDEQGQVTEKEFPRPDTQAGQQLLEVEQMFFNSPRLNTAVVRFGGLIGGSRNPVRFLAGREGLSNGQAPVNLIHREDALQILFTILQKKAFGRIFNAVHPDHPVKKDYYRQKAIELNLEPPSYTEDSEEDRFKQIDSVNLQLVLNYAFKESI